MGFKVERYHDISCGHRVAGHEGKCRLLHGHNYRIHFICEVDKSKDDDPERLCTSIAEFELDTIGRVIDFSEVKNKLCQWVEDNWDHKFLAWDMDNLFIALRLLGPDDLMDMDDIFGQSIVLVPFNPTAENMAQYLVEVIGPKQLRGTDIVLTKVVIEETSKCQASYEI